MSIGNEDGRPIQPRQNIPGTVPIKDREFRYFECADDGASFEEVFQAMAAYRRDGTPVKREDYPKAGRGGMQAAGYRIWLPNGSPFVGITYKDIGGVSYWRDCFDAYMRHAEIRTGFIREDKIILSDGVEYKPADCKTEDTSATRRVITR